MKKFSFFEVFENRDAKEITLRCTESQVMEELTSVLETIYNQVNLKKILKHPDEIIYQYSLDVSKDSPTSILWRIFSFLCASNWEPLGSSHFVYGGEYSTSSIEIYQFKKQTTEPPYSPEEVSGRAV